MTLVPNSPRVEAAIEEASAVIVGLETLNRTFEHSARRDLVSLTKSSANTLLTILEALSLEEEYRQKGI